MRNPDVEIVDDVDWVTDDAGDVVVVVGCVVESSELVVVAAVLESSSVSSEVVAVALGVVALETLVAWPVKSDAL